MFGLSFLNSIFLAGLVAGAIPVIIHLLNRRRIRRVKFSSLEFLDEVSRRRMSKINLRRIIILVLRTLAVLFLVMAFARPTIRSTFALPGKAPKNVVVCLDVSYSMGLERREGTAFTLAKDIARRVVDEAGKNDEINLVLFSEQAQAQLEQGTRNKSLIKNAIDKAELTCEATSIRRGVDAALDVIDRGDLKGGEVYVVSDFRFNEDTTLVNTDRLGDNTRVFFLPVYDEDADNVSVDRVTVPRKLLRPGEVIRVGVAVTNRSRVNPVNFPLELTVDGDRKAEKVIDLAPSASTTVTFPISFTEWGTYHCSVSKNPDRLPVDDTRYFLLEVSKSVPVTLVRGRRRAGNRPDERVPGFFYLEKALNPRGTSEGEFTVRTIDERDLTTSALPARGVVVWVDPQRLEANRLALLERYVDRGGGLMVFLGEGDRSLWQSREFQEFLGMHGAVERAGEVRVGYTSFQQDHPIFSIFSDEELELLSRTRVRSYVSASGVAPDSTLAYIGGGDPAVCGSARAARGTCSSSRLLPTSRAATSRSRRCSSRSCTRRCRTSRAPARRDGRARTTRGTPCSSTRPRRKGRGSPSAPPAAAWSSPRPPRRRTATFGSSASARSRPASTACRATPPRWPRPSSTSTRASPTSRRGAW